MARTEVTGKQIKDQSVDLAVDVTGVLPVANGGTGSSSLTLNNVLLGNGTGSLQSVSPGTAGNVLTSNGSTWVSAVPAAAQVTLNGSETLSNKTLTNPKIQNINDLAGTVALQTATTGGTNFLQITNSVGNPGFTVVSNNADQSLFLSPKGSGTVRVFASSGNTPTLTGAGADANHNLNLQSQGSGVVQANGIPVVTTTGSQTLTNKTISGSSNTLSNIPQSAVTSLTTDITGLLNRARAATQAGNNLLTNTAFIFSDFIQSYGTLSSEQSRLGNTSLKITGTGQLQYPSLVSDTAYQRINVRKGQKFYYEMWVYGHASNTITSGTSELISFGLWFYDKAGTYQASAREWTKGNGDTIGTGQWVLISGTLTVPDDDDITNMVPLLYVSTNLTAGNILYVDAVVLREVTEAVNINQALYGTNTTGTNILESSLPSTAVTTTASQTLTNKTLTTPTIITPTVRGFLLKDSNDNNIAAHSNAAVGTGTSYLSLAPGTGSPGPSVTATSSETNTGLVFWTKGTGLTQFRSNANSGQSVALRLVPHASGVNWLDIANAPSGSSPTLKSVSYGNTDTNVGLNLEALGSGMISLKSDNVHVSGGSVTSLKVDSEGTLGRSELLLNDDGDTKAYVQWRGSTNPAIPNTLRIQTNTGVTGDIVIGDQGASRIFIAGGQNGLTAGRVGIGTATPSSTLDVNGEIRQQAVPVVTTTGSQTLTNKTISGANNTFSSIPATAVPGAAQYVRAHGSVAGQWYRIFTFSPPGNPFFRFSAVYAISCFSQGGAVIGVHIGNWGENSVGGNVEFIGKGTLPLLARDSFKLVGDGYGQPFELWVKTTASGSALAYYEVSRYGSGYTTYDTSNTPQATEPVGQVLNVKSSGLASLDVGSGDQASTATPAYINLGGTYGNSTPGSSNNLKLRLFDNGTGSNHFGLGVSDAKLEYQVPSTSTHRFYVGGTERLTVSSSAVQVGGVDVVTTTAAQTLTNKTLTQPVLNNPWVVSSLKDANGATLLGTTATASAVNYLDVKNAASGGHPAFTASGSDANIHIDLAPKGSGFVRITGVPVVTETRGQTLTNKTISGSSNTLSDVPQSAITGLTTDLGTAQTTAETAQKFIDLKASGLPNLASDPSCSTPELWDTNGFGSNWTGEISTDQAASGTTSLKMTITGSSYPSLTFLRTSTGNYVPDADSLKVRPGDKFYMEAYIRAHPDNVVTDKGLYIQAWSTDSTGVNSYAFTNNANTIPTSTEWTKITHTYTVPAGRDRLNVRVAGNLNHGIGDVYYIDKLLWLNVTDTQDIIDNVYQGINGGASTWNSLASMKSSLGTVVTLAGSQTLTNKTLTTPTIEVINGTNGGPFLKGYSGTAAGSNHFVLSGTNTGNPVYFSARGDDANIAMYVQAKGSGTLVLKNDNGTSATFGSFANSVNRIDFYGRETGQAPSLSANGADTNVSLNLTTKGSGTVKANGVDVVTTTGAQALTNKTLTGPVINGLPTGTGVSSAATGNTLAARNSAGDTTFRYLHAVWVSNSHAVVTRNSDTAFYSTNDNYIRKNTATGFKTSLALNNVDNTSDATKNSAVATLTNKTLTSPTISTPTINGTTTISGDVTVDNGTSSLVVIRSDDTGTSGLLLRGQSQGTSYVEVTQDGSYGGGMSFFGGGGSTFATGESTDSVTFYRKGAGTRTAVFGYGWNSNNVNFAGNIAVAGNITSGGIAVPTISSSSTLTNKTISGSSNTLTNISISSLSNAPSLFNNMGEVHQQRTSFDAQGAASTVDFGWRYVQGSTNGPGTNSATQYYSQFVGLGSNYAYNTYGMQIAYPRNVTSPYISIRYQEGSVFGSWRKISAGYADSAGDADTLDGQHASAFVTPSGTATLTNKTLTSPTISDPVINGNATGTAISTANTANTLVKRDGNGDFYIRYVFSSYLNMSHGVSGTTNDTIFYSSKDNYIRKNNASGFKSSLGLNNVDNTSDATKNSATATLTNKRITPRIGSVTSTATPSINTDIYDQYNITALATNITSVTITGTPTDGQKLMLRIKDNGTARAITWGASFVSSGTATLLTTTVVNKTHLVGLLYDSAAAKWVCIAADSLGY